MVVAAWLDAGPHEKNGHVPIPQGVGLGVSYDWDWLKKNQVGSAVYE